MQGARRGALEEAGVRDLCNRVSTPQTPGLVPCLVLSTQRDWRPWSRGAGLSSRAWRSPRPKTLNSRSGRERRAPPRGTGLRRLGENDGTRGGGTPRAKSGALRGNAPSGLADMQGARCQQLPSHPPPPGSARVTQGLHADPIVSAAPRSFGLQSTEGFLALGPLCMTLPWGTYVVHICPNPQGARLQE